MSLVSNLLNQYIDEIKTVTTDVYNDVTESIAYEDVLCRWQTKLKTWFDSEGIVKESTIEVWILTEYIINTTDVFYKNDIRYEVVAVDEGIDLSGTLDHWKVYLK